MKKIFKLIRLLSHYYPTYRIIITGVHIELKLSPKRNEDNEINWIVENDKEGKEKLRWSLEETCRKHNLEHLI